jgi:hypothetical protein
MLEIAQCASPIKRVETTPRSRRDTIIKTGTCRECGERFEAKRSTREFCRAACRQAFHNRAASRGAELYHLFMAARFDRGSATAAGAWSTMCRLASIFRAEDIRDCGGRQTWDAVAKVKARNAHLLATVVDTNAAGRRRPRRRK